MFKAFKSLQNGETPLNIVLPPKNGFNYTVVVSDGSQNEDFTNFPINPRKIIDINGKFLSNVGGSYSKNDVLIADNADDFDKFRRTVRYEMCQHFGPGLETGNNDDDGGDDD